MNAANFLRLAFVNLIVMAGFAGGVWWLTANGYAQPGWSLAPTLGLAAVLGTSVIGLVTYAALRGPIGGLKSICNAIAKSTGHLVDASQSASSASTQQAASIQEAVATVTEMSASIQKSAEYAEKSREVSDISNRVARDGKKAVQEMIRSMDEINLSNSTIVAEIEKGYDRITEIVRVITEISQKTKIINDIVFQTKLLSFNASVEAARAGEHGKGFAVVAEEIGNLAKMSGNASRDISVMLSSSIEKVNTIVGETSKKVQNLVEGEKNKVDAGIQVARECGDVLQEIVLNVSTVNTMVAEISKATQEQAQGMNEISTAMTQLDAVTQQNAETAQAAAEYSGEISLQTDSLRNTLKKLRSTLMFMSEIDFNANFAHKPSPSGTAKVLPMRRPGTGTQSKMEKPKAMLEVSGSNVPLSEDPDFEDV